MEERSTARRSARVVLDDWRGAERKRDEELTGTEGWAEADRRVRELRGEFHETVRDVDDAAGDSADPRHPPA